MTLEQLSESRRYINSTAFLFVKGQMSGEDIAKAIDYLVETYKMAESSAISRMNERIADMIQGLRS